MSLLANVHFFMFRHCVLETFEFTVPVTWLRNLVDINRVRRQKRSSRGYLSRCPMYVCVCE